MEDKMENKMEAMEKMEKMESRKARKERFGKAVKWVCMVGWVIPLLLLVWNLGGRNLLNRLGLSGYTPLEARTEETSIPVMNYDLGEEINQALDRAHKEAEAYVDGELDSWIGDVMARLDRDFMDDYFGVVNTYWREASTMGLWVTNKLGFTDSPEDVMTRKLEDMVSKRIIRPEISQQRIKNITDSAVDIYLTSLDTELQKIRQAHRIPTPDWNRYICDITEMTMGVESRTYPVSAKAFWVSGGAIALASAPALVNVAKTVFTKIAQKTGLKVAEKAGAKVAVKTVAKAGGKTVAKAIPVIGWGVTAGILIWDILDHKASAEKGKAMLKESMQDYMNTVKDELMGNTENSIMGAITEWENKVKRNIMEKK